jgi:cob(I)alamin adenosyltransferase
MIQTYFGNGKGKTTAAIGAAIRFAGSGGKVLFVQFLKNNDSAEFKALEATDSIDILFSKEKYQLFDNLKKERMPTLTKAYNKLLFEDVKNEANNYQMIILDEILDVVEFGYVNEDELLKLIDELKNDMEIIMTGHNLAEKIKLVSDYISEIKEINHPYKKGVMPRKGIEF